MYVSRCQRNHRRYECCWYWTIWQVTKHQALCVGASHPKLWCCTRRWEGRGSIWQSQFNASSNVELWRAVNRQQLSKLLPGSKRLARGGTAIQRRLRGAANEQHGERVSDNADTLKAVQVPIPAVQFAADGLLPINGDGRDK